MTAQEKIWASKSCTVYMDGSSPLQASTRQFHRAEEYTLTASIAALIAAAVQAREAELFAILDRMIAAMREECWKHELSSDLMGQAISEGSLSALEVFAAAMRGDAP